MSTDIREAKRLLGLNTDKGNADSFPISPLDTLDNTKGVPPFVEFNDTGISSIQSLPVTPLNEIPDLAEEEVSATYKYSPIEAKAALFGTYEERELTQLEAKQRLYNDAVGIPNKPTKLELKEVEVLDKIREKSQKFNGNAVVEEEPRLNGIPFIFLNKEEKVRALANQKIEVAVAAQERTERLRREQKSWLTDEQADSGLGYAVNQLLLLGGATAKMGITVAQIPFHAMETYAEFGITDGDMDTYNSLAVRAVNGYPLTKKQEEFTKTRAYRSIVVGNSMDKISGIMDTWKEGIAAQANTKNTEDFTKETGYIAADTVKQFKKGNIAEGIGDFLGNVGTLVSDNPADVADIVAGVLPQMLMLLRFTATSVVSLTSQDTEKAMDDFIAEYGRQPTDIERTITIGAATAATLIDLGSAKVVLGGKKLLEGIKKTNVNTPSNVIDKAESKLKSLGKKVITSTPVRGTATITKGIAVEGVTEGAQNALLQYAGKQDINKIDPVEVLTDATIGGVVGGALRGSKPVIENTAAALGLVGKGIKKTSEVVTPIVSKASNTIADRIVTSDVKVDKVVARAKEEENPEVGIETLLRQNFSKMEPKRREESLAKAVEFVGVLSKQITTAKGTFEEKESMNAKVMDYMVKLKKLADANIALKNNPDKKTTTELLDILSNKDTESDSKQSAVDTLMGEINTGGSVSLKETSRTLGNQEFKKLTTKEDIVIVEKYQKYLKAINKVKATYKKNTTEVHDDILNGVSGKFTGISSYMDQVRISIGSNEVETTRKAIKGLRRLYKSQLDKYRSGKFDPIKPIIADELRAIKAAVEQAEAMGLKAFGATSKVEPEAIVPETKQTPIPTENKPNTSKAVKQNTVGSATNPITIPSKVSDSSLDIDFSVDNNDIESVTEIPIATSTPVKQENVSTSVPSKEQPITTDKDRTPTTKMKTVRKTKAAKRAEKTTYVEDSKKIIKELEEEGITVPVVRTKGKGLSNIKKFSKYIDRRILKNKEIEDPARRKLSYNNIALTVDTGKTLFNINPEISEKEIRDVTAIRNKLRKKPKDEILQKELRDITIAYVGKEVFTTTGLTTIIDDVADVSRELLTKGVSPDLNNKGVVYLKDRDYPERNSLSTFLKSSPNTKGDSPFRSISNLASKLMSKVTRQDTLMKLPEMSEEQLKALPHLLGFIKEFNTKFPSMVKFLSDKKFYKGDFDGSFTEGRKNNPYGDPFGYLVQTDPNGNRYLSENLMTAIGVASYNWLGTQATKTIHNNESTIRAITKTPDSYDLPFGAYGEFTYAGSIKASVAETITKDVIRQLGLVEKEGVDGTFLPKLKMAIGVMATDTLLSMGYLEQTAKTAATMASYLSNELKKTHTPDSMVPFVKVKVKNNVPIEAVKAIVDSHSNSDNLISDVFGMSNSIVYPTFSPNKKVASKIKNSFMDVPSEVKKTVAKLQSTAWVARQELNTILDSLPDSVRDPILGIVTDFSEVHDTERDAIENKNVSIKRGYGLAKDFISTFDSPNKEVYFSYDVWGNTRTGMRGVITPQGNKTHRSQFGIKDSKTVIHSQASRNIFKLAVVQAFGSKLNSEHLEDLFSRFDEILNDEGVQKAIVAIKTGKDLESLVAPVLMGRESTLTLHALVALSKYDPKESFITDLTIETDGTTNGIAHAVMQAMSDTSNYPILHAAGVYTDGITKSQNTWLAVEGQYDNYVQLAKNWGRELLSTVNYPKLDSSAVGFLHSITADLINDSTSTGRSLSKSPLMVSIYGASIKRIREVLSQNALKTFYSNLAKAKDQQEVDSIIQGFNSLTGLSVVPPEHSDRRSKELGTVEARELDIAIQGTYGIALEKVLDTKYKQLRTFREAVNNASKLMFEIFNLHYKNAMDIAVANKDGLELTNKEKDDLILGMLDRVPTIKTAFSAASDVLSERYLAMDTERVRDYSSRSKRIQVQHPGVIGNTISPVQPKGTSSTVATYSETVFTSSINSTTIGAIHSIDSFNVLSVLDKVQGLNVFDAIDYSIKDVIEGTKLHNKSFLTGHKEYSIISSVVTSLESMLDIAYKDKTLYKELPKSMDKHPGLRKFKSPGKFLAYMKRGGYNINKHRKSFKATAVAHFSFFEQGTYFPEESQTKELTDVEYQNAITDSVDVIVDDAVNTLTQKSSDETFDFDNFQSVEHFELTHKTTERIFNELGKEGSITDPVVHTEYLKSVLGNMINKVIKPADEITLDINREKDHVLGAIRDNEIKIHAGRGVIGNLQQMSAQETLIHELVHRITTSAIQSNSKLRNEVEKLFQEIKANTTYEDFLSYDSGGNVISAVNTDKEIQAAKDRYNYIFNSSKYTHVIQDNRIKKVYSSDYLYEFMAFGISNAKFREVLSNKKAKTKPKIESTDTWIEKVGKVFQNLLSWINGKLTKFKDKPENVFADTQLTTLVNEIVGLNVKNDRDLFMNKALNTFDGIIKLNKPLLDALNIAIFSPWENARTKLKNKDNKNKFDRAALTVLSTPNFFKSDDWVGRLTRITRGIKLTESSFLIKILREGMSIDKQNAVFHTLLRISKHVVDSARKHLANEVAADLLSYFEESPTKAERKAVTRVMLQGNMSALFDSYSMPEIQELLTDRLKIEKEIDNKKDQLRSFNIHNGKQVNDGNYYAQQAENLASVMVVGETLLADGNLNTHNIARMVGVSSSKPSGDVVLAEGIINELVALWALHYNSDSDKKILADLVKREYARGDMNGIENVLLNYKRINELALDQTFNHNKYQMLDGYVQDIFDENITIKVDLKSREAELKLEGYIDTGTVLVDDPAIKGMTGTLAMYAFNGGAVAAQTKGIVSQTNKNTKGTTPEELFKLNSPLNSKVEAAVALKRIRRVNDRAVKKQFDSMTIPSSVRKENYMSPINDDRGNISGYRYMMSETIKHNVLKRNYDFAMILGKMEGKVLDKVNSAKVNKTALLAIHEDAKKYYDDDPGAFVVIGPKSSDIRLREISSLMPKDMKRDLQQIWNSDTIIVREKYLDLIFGFKKMSILNMYGIREVIHNKQLNKLFNFPVVAKYIEDAWQEITAIIKNNIVIKSPLVVFNTVSNNILLWTKGVPSKDILPDELDAIYALNEFHKDYTIRNNLQRKKDNYPNMSVDMKRNIEARIGQLNEKLNDNIVKDLVSEGIFQNIIEDIEVDMEGTGFTLKDKIADKIEDFADKYISPTLTNVYKQVYLTERTSSYRMLLKSTQYSDFVARYTLYKHNTKTLGMSKEQALVDIVETFVNYDVPTSPEMQYLNDMGILMFTKFLFRIQRVIFKIFKDNPANALTVLGMQEMLGDVSDIGDSVLLLNGVNLRNAITESPGDLMHIGSVEVVSGIWPG